VRIDSESGRYYVADRSAGGVDVIDAESDTFVTTITGFVGNVGSGVSGPNGVLVINKRGELGAGEDHHRKELWAGDGNSTVKVVDLETNSIVDSISTGGTHRADELAYDPADKIILIANDRDAVPFVTFISAETRTVLGSLSISIPSTVANPNGEVDEINPKTRSITRVFAVSDPAFAGPAGLALLPGQRLITSTGVVFDAKTGATLATIARVAGDEIWYNSGDDRVYFGGTPIFAVDATTYAVTQFDAGDTHSIAADSENNRIFIPVTSIGVKVYTDDEDQPGHE
jgi:DNA-binding beta-propeller fold protein YncE